MTETNAKPIEPTCSMCPSYPRIRAELDRLRADRQLEADIDLPPGVITLMRENEGLKASLAEKDAECERLKSEIEGDLVVYANLEESHRAVNAQLKIEGKRAQDMANLAASRLADQEGIERHVTKRVATECAEIAEKMAAACMEDGHCSADVIADKIRENYGVE